MKAEELVELIKKEDVQVLNLRSKAISGNNALLMTFIEAINQLLKDKQQHPKTYKQITQLCISASPYIVGLVNTDTFKILPNYHSNTNLNSYIILWKRLFNGTPEKIDYPNVKNTLESIRTNGDNIELKGQFLRYSKQFEKNMNVLQDKRIQFFQDFQEDSFITDSADEELVSDIISMDIEQVKAIRSHLQKSKIDGVTTEEYLIKMKNFLAHKPSTLSKELSEDFNHQRLWAKHYLSSYKDYLISDQSNNSVPPPQFKVAVTSPKLKNPSGLVLQNKSYEQVKVEEPPPRHTFNKKRVMKDTKEVLKNPQSVNVHIEQQRVSLPSKIENENLQTSKFPIVQSRYQNDAVRPPHSPIQSPIHHENGPNFILNTSEMNEMMRNSAGSNRQRPKIFENKDRNSRFTYTNKQEEEDDLVVIKHTKKQNESFRHTINEVNYKPSQTYQSPKNNQNRFLSPKAVFSGSVSEQRMKSSSKKLSDYTEQKRQRKKMAPFDELSPIQSYILKPYSQNFNYIENFARFRRNCLQDNFTIYVSSFILVSCIIKREPSGLVKVQILYANQSKNDLYLQTLYRIPKCFKIEKLTKITKKFILKDYSHHVFKLQMISFPLEACLLNLKYRIVNTPDLNQNPTIVSIPITLRNFLQFLLVNQTQWKRYWARWSQNGHNFRIVKHVLLDKTVLSDDQISDNLHEFVNIGAVQGYSIDEYGGYCQHPSFPNLTFLLRISIRIHNILSIELLTDRRVNKLDDEKDFLEYCLDNWAMLLGKIEGEDID